MISAAAMAAYARLFGHQAPRPKPVVHIEVAPGTTSEDLAEAVVQAARQVFGPPARPIPTAEEEARLTPWERAWGRLTDDEKTWSST